MGDDSEWRVEEISGVEVIEADDGDAAAQVEELDRADRANPAAAVEREQRSRWRL